VAKYWIGKICQTPTCARRIAGQQLWLVEDWAIRDFLPQVAADQPSAAVLRRPTAVPQ